MVLGTEVHKAHVDTWNKAHVDTWNKAHVDTWNKVHVDTRNKAEVGTMTLSSQTLQVCVFVRLKASSTFYR